MIKGAIGIVGLAAVVWAVGCGTHSGIGNLGMGGNGGAGTGGQVVIGTGGEGVGIGGQGVIGTGGDLGIGGEGIVGMGGNPGTGGQVNLGIGGQRASCPGATPPIGTAKTLAFAAPADYDTGAGAYAVTTGDLNGDGKLDLLLLDNPVGIRLMLNKGDGTFGVPADFGIGPIPYAVALGDLDGDGKIDIVGVSQFGVSVFLNKGNAVFSQPVSYVVGIGSGAPALGDLNGDGKLDIAVADQGDGISAGDVGILLNVGDGTFVAANYPTSRQSYAMAIGDLDNDCQPDLALVGPAGASVMRNNMGQFPIATNLGNGTSGTSVAVADLNGDGKLDVVEGVGVDSVEGRTYVFINRGNASFNAPITYGLNGTLSGAQSPPGGNSLALGDMNGDGRPEMLTIGSCCGLGVFPNHGDGTFPSSVSFATAPSPRWLAAGDLNGDGQPDVAVVSIIGPGVTRGLRVLINASH